MEVGKKTSKRRFTVNRSETFSIRAEYVNVQNWELTITFNLTIVKRMLVCWRLRYLRKSCTCSERRKSRKQSSTYRPSSFKPLFHRRYVVLRPSNHFSIGSRQFNSSSPILISLFFMFCMYVLSSNLYAFIFVRHFPSLPFLILTFCAPHTPWKFNIAMIALLYA